MKKNKIERAFEYLTTHPVIGDTFVLVMMLFVVMPYLDFQDFIETIKGFLCPKKQ